MRKSFTLAMIGTVLIASFMVTGCGSTQPLMAGGEMQIPGFFSGLLGGLLWPISLIFMGFGWCSALYFHYNSGIGYWIGYWIGFSPYAIALLGMLFMIITSLFGIKTKK